MNYKISCTCGKYETAPELSYGTAQYAAEMHVMLGKEHKCTIWQRIVEDNGTVNLKKMQVISNVDK